jgi:hypothetical protein
MEFDAGYQMASFRHVEDGWMEFDAGIFVVVAFNFRSFTMYAERPYDSQRDLFSLIKIYSSIVLCALAPVVHTLPMYPYSTNALDSVLTRGFQVNISAQQVSILWRK